jgi:hypothetical protein
MSHASFPSFADYQSALQHPERAFSHNFLRQSSVESDLWGFPRVRSGGFALTYKLSLNDKLWAARCFHRVVRDRFMRYTEICNSLDELRLPFFLTTRYLHRGIAVQGKYFPMTLVEWVEGDSLETYILHNLENPDKLLGLSDKFRDVCRQMELRNIAHGDLSHRNIIVKSDEIFLIDYDGMYVPALSGKKSSELGNIHFQHPQRTNAIFNNRMDRFSSIVIYLALLGLAGESGLWRRFQSGGEGLLFQRSDFLNPHGSQLLMALERNPLTARFVPRFRQICRNSMEDTPSLEELIVAHTFEVTTDQAGNQLWNLLEKKKSEVPILYARDTAAINRLQGELATVVGKITEVFHGQTLEDEEHIFINFGDWQQDCFTGVLWGPVLEDMKGMDFSFDSWVGEWMSIRGLISVRNKRPQIQVDAVTDCVLLGSEEKAGRLLNREKPSQRRPVMIDSSLNIHLSVSHSSQNSGSVNGSSKNDAKILRLTDLFDRQKDPSVEFKINELYSKKQFKKRRKRSS